VTVKFIAIERTRGRADERTLGWGHRFIRAHEGRAMTFSSALDAEVAALRATNRVAGSRISTMSIEGVTG
jgi:hypothetical protein